MAMTGEPGVIAPSVSFVDLISLAVTLWSSVWFGEAIAVVVHVVSVASTSTMVVAAAGTDWA